MKAQPGLIQVFQTVKDSADRLNQKPALAFAPGGLQFATVLVDAGPRFQTIEGFGGAFTVTYPEVSRAMMEDKVRNIVTSGADTVVMCEPGCLMNIAGGLQKAGSAIRAMHIIDLLAAREGSV